MTLNLHHPHRSARLRLAAPVVGALAVVGISAGSAAAASDPAPDPTPASATVGDVGCANGDGTLTVSLQAGTDAADFVVLLDGSPYGDTGDYPVDAGAGQEVTVAGLDDGDHTIEVSTTGDTATEVASVTRTVACDPAPGAPYANPRGAVWDSCGLSGEVQASNRPIGGDTTDLQPVDFTVTFTPLSDPGSTDPGSTDPGSTGPGTIGDPPPPARHGDTPTPVTLDTFTLDTGTPTYQKSFGSDVITGFGQLTLTAGQTEIASAVVGGCVAVPDALPNAGGSISSATGGTGPRALPNTGMDATQLELAGLGAALIGLGSGLTRFGRRPTDARRV